MRNQLTPTTITDKNGKITTVHRRDVTSGKTAAVLTGIKPSVAPSSSVSSSGHDSKPVKVKWKISPASMPMMEGSFLDRVGLIDEVKQAEVKHKGHEMTQGEVFDFMKLGISFHEAAALHQIGGSLSNWLDEPSFQNALPGNHARVFVKDEGWRPVELDETIELLKRENVPFSRASKIIKNGLCDELLRRSVLEPNDLFDLFVRFSYQPSINPDVSTNSTAVVDALNEGLLPRELIKDTAADKSTMANTINTLYPPEKNSTASPQSPYEINESVRAELIADPHKLVQAILVMSNYSSLSGEGRLRSLTTAVEAINAYGLDACIEHNPKMLMHRLSDGTTMGPERTQAAKETSLALVEMMPENSWFSNYFTTTGMESRIDDQPVPVDYADIAELHLMGMSDQEVFDRTLAISMESYKAVAIARNTVTPAVSSGWL